MPSASPIQSNFNAGQLTELLSARTDLAKRGNGVKVMQNMLPLIQGPATRRSGTSHVASVKTPANRTALIPFEFSTEQAYVIEVGDQYFRYYKDNGVILEAAKTITGITQANPAVVTSNSHGFTNGDEVEISGVVGMTQVNGKRFTVAGVTTNTFQLSGINSTGFTAYGSAGTASRVFTLATPYTQANLFDSDNRLRLNWTQSADILYLCHNTYPPRKLSRTGHTSWTIETITFEDGPYLNANTTDTTLDPSATTGTGVTLVASATTGINDDAGFKSTDVGRLIRFKDGSNFSYFEITGFTSTTQVTVTIKGPDLANHNASTDWRLGVFSETTGYPSAVIFYEDRLWFGGATNFPQRLDGSRTGDYYNFAPTDADGTVADDHAVSFTLSANMVNLIQWLDADEKGLLVGTVGGEWVVRASSQSEAITPTNIQAKPSSTRGSANVRPIRCGRQTLFVQRAGKKLRDFEYVFEDDGFRSQDVSILSPEITGNGVLGIDYQQEPDSTIWLVREDGTLLGVSYDKQQEAIGWHTHVMGGVSDTASNIAKVEALAVIPSPTEGADQLWLIVQRLVDGSTVRYVEYLNQTWADGDKQKLAFFVDSGLTLNAPLTITGATQANPVVITSNGHGLTNGDLVRIDDIAGMTELNTRTFTVAGSATNTFQLSGENGSAHTAYISGGEARKKVTCLTGLDHLEGQTLKVLVDGGAHDDKTVSSGAITLDRASAIVHAGLAFTSALETLPIEAGSREGTSQGKTKRISHVVFRFFQTLGGFYGTSSADMTEFVFREGGDLLDQAVPLFTGDKEVSWPGGYDRDGVIRIESRQPLPLTLQAIMPSLVTQDD